MNLIGINVKFLLLYYTLLIDSFLLLDLTNIDLKQLYSNNLFLLIFLAGMCYNLKVYICISIFLLIQNNTQLRSHTTTVSSTN